MTMKFNLNLLLLSLFSVFLLAVSCKHEPLVDDDDLPIDTVAITEPCDTNTIYFDSEVLPILVSNCAISGCHDAVTASDDVVLTSYATVMETGKIKAFDLDDSEVYEVITEDDEEDIMPPLPNLPLSANQIQVIADWIEQGALRIVCEDMVCETENRSFSTDIEPILATYCLGCHSGATPLGNLDLTTYDNVKTVVDIGTLWGVINWNVGFTPMPQGGAKLPQCAIDQIESWINDGAPNN